MKKEVKTYSKKLNIYELNDIIIDKFAKKQPEKFSVRSVVGDIDFRPEFYKNPRGVNRTNKFRPVDVCFIKDDNKYVVSILIPRIDKNLMYNYAAEAVIKICIYQELGHYPSAAAVDALVVTYLNTRYKKLPHMGVFEDMWATEYFSMLECLQDGPYQLLHEWLTKRSEASMKLARLAYDTFNSIFEADVKLNNQFEEMLLVFINTLDLIDKYGV